MHHLATVNQTVEVCGTCQVEAECAPKGYVQILFQIQTKEKSVRGHPRGSKFVPLNSWGRGSY